jgi:hypothetical protein
MKKSQSAKTQAKDSAHVLQLADGRKNLVWLSEKGEEGMLSIWEENPEGCRDESYRLCVSTTHFMMK